MPKIEFNYNFNKDTNRWESLLELKHGEVHKASAMYYPDYLSVKDFLNGFQKQIKALDEAISALELNTEEITECPLPRYTPTP